MLIQNLKVFDDYVAPATVTLTSDRWNEALGRCSAINVTAVIEDIGPGGPGTFGLFLIESSDNRNWYLRGTNAPGITNYYGYGEITIADVESGAQYVRMFSDACRGISLLGSTVTGPLLPFVRFSMITSVVRCRVQLYAACRGSRRW